MLDGGFWVIAGRILAVVDPSRELSSGGAMSTSPPGTSSGTLQQLPK